MTILGVNADPSHGFQPEDILSVGATAVRVVLRPDIDRHDFLTACKAAGVTTLGVIAYESMFKDSIEMSYADAANWYMENYGGDVDMLQVGNEPDITSPSSWTLEPGELQNLLWEFYWRFSETPLVLAGMASGNPAYVKQVGKLWCDYIAIHPYGQRPSPEADDWADLPGNFGYVADLVDAYRSFGKEIIISEYGANQDETGPELYTRYIPAMTQALCGLGLPYIFHFCLSDEMVSSFGLLTSDRKEKTCVLGFRNAPKIAGRKSMKIEEFVKGHPELTAPLGPDGKPLWGTPIVLTKQARIAGFDNHIVIELNGECWVADNDNSFFE